MIIRKMIIALSLLVILVTDSQAFGEIRYSTSILRIRQDRSVNSPVVGYLQKGQKIRIDRSRDGWTAVFEPWMEDDTARIAGYVREDYLSETDPGTDIQPLGVLKNVNMMGNCRKGPGEGHAVNRVLEPGMVVRVDDESYDREWVQVYDQKSTIRSVLNSYGWVQRELLKPVQAATAPTGRAVESSAVFSLPASKTPSLLSPPVTKAPAVLSPAAIPAKMQNSQGSADKTVPVLGVPLNLAGQTYRIIDKVEGLSYGRSLDKLVLRLDWKGALDLGVMEKFTDAIWEKYRVVNRDLLVDIYLPGMDDDDPSFITAEYDHSGRIKFWYKESALYGTSFFKQPPVGE